MSQRNSGNCKISRKKLICIDCINVLLQVAIDLIVKQVKTQLADRGYDANKYTQQRMQLANANSVPHAQLPETLSIVKQTPQVLGLHTFIRNRETPRFVTFHISFVKSQEKILLSINN